MIFNRDYLEYVNKRDFDSLKIDNFYDDVFNIVCICKLTVRFKLINQYFPKTQIVQVI